MDILKQHQNTVDAVFDGEAALAFAKAENYDCLILDAAIPRISGFEIIRKKRPSHGLKIDDKIYKNELAIRRAYNHP